MEQLHNKPFTNEQEERIKVIVLEALHAYFESKSKGMRTVLITTATIIGALTIIVGGFKSLLAWLGFTYIGK